MTTMFIYFVAVMSHSHPQSLRSFWPAAGIERLWEQPFQVCAIDADYVRPDNGDVHVRYSLSIIMDESLVIKA